MASLLVSESFRPTGSLVRSGGDDLGGFGEWDGAKGLWWDYWSGQGLVVGHYRLPRNQTRKGHKSSMQP